MYFISSPAWLFLEGFRYLLWLHCFPSGSYGNVHPHIFWRCFCILLLLLLLLHG
ncbi:uncharacterized protein BO66DRAFT_36562 [Aspergillus aculeatinus CBS 121060]|uniref:Uncharacterized protein n=1 Tax=Aspergillus aculeatinus CBS 121060 TaxID=1448322 RepID=A0ACD1HF04_9EURO|nr:hypothetical protein BO66DRAFT_36562 [Aspergillus aculeatinus CBS 121060]RAH72047.1 hypothetical protein BO66DRAFT_36562 [Aspergillus aculeatinus CBS 121060]